MKQTRFKYYMTVTFMSFYMLSCLFALVFATGVGNGLKLDDNQILGYLDLAFLSISIIATFFMKRQKMKRYCIFACLLFLVLFLLLMFANIVSFNEAVFIFVIPIWISAFLAGYSGIYYLVASREKN
ncbi:membrane protein [Listeria floridensis FSL S10-1187]|uniref:Membrane protein n=1 Tax=Listeria floridensis FSL S10-1187 TaxID=1265817 RepID=A0ABP3B166_9LIST|nr:hypothetical protein [Listeria floridensis]EUJ33619.1 membrane protein [Listeria floridensis FSL S10-1187]